MFGHHGVLEWEQREGQTLLYDITLEVDEPAEDRVEEATDYRDIVAKVEEVSDGTRFDLIESLAAAAADGLVAAFPAVHSVLVRVRKPKPVGIPAEWSAATASRSR